MAFRHALATAVTGTLVLVGVLATTTPPTSAAPANAAPPDAAISPVRAAADAAADPDEVLVRLAAELGEPRHYCLDIPGYPTTLEIDNHREAMWALEAHTCKIGIPNQDAALLDMYLSRSGLESGKIRFARLDACMEVPPNYLQSGILREDAPIVVNHCADVATQSFQMDADGRIRPDVDPTKCLTIGASASEAGDRATGEHWYRRPLTLRSCDLPSVRQVWEVATAPANPPELGPAVDRPDPGPERQTWQLTPLPSSGDPDETLVQLVDTLGEPRHFCLDIPGYPVTLDIANHREAHWALESHTCKTGIPNEDAALLDMAISRTGLEEGRLSWTRLDACVEVAIHREGVVREDSPLIVNPCADAEPAQEMVMGSDGRIRPAMDPTKCLTVHPQAFEAGNRAPGEPWFRRPLTFSSCASTPAQADLVVRHRPRTVVAGETRPTLHVGVSAEGAPAEGRVRVRLGGGLVTSASLVDGEAAVRLPAFARAGRKTVTVRYLGYDAVAPATVEHTIRVRRR